MRHTNMFCGGNVDLFTIKEANDAYFTIIVFLLIIFKIYLENYRDF